MTIDVPSFITPRLVTEPIPIVIEIKAVSVWVTAACAYITDNDLVMSKENIESIGLELKREWSETRDARPLR